MEKTNIQRGALSWKLILEAVPKRCLTQLKVKLFPWAGKKRGGGGCQTSLLYNGGAILKRIVQSKCIQT